MNISNPNDQFSASASNAKKSAQQFKSGVENTADSVLSDATGTIKDTLNKASSKVHDLYDYASDEITHAKEVVTKQVNDKPVQSSLIALGIGLVLGRLIRR